MNDKIQTAIDIKPAILSAVGGGALTFTAGNVISLVGMCVGVAGMVIGFLQWKENQRRRMEMKRANDIAERRLNWDISDKVKGNHEQL